jgi:hypothetical protein
MSGSSTATFWFWPSHVASVPSKSRLQRCDWRMRSAQGKAIRCDMHPADQYGALANVCFPK